MTVRDRQEGEERSLADALEDLESWINEVSTVQHTEEHEEAMADIFTLTDMANEWNDIHRRSNTDPYISIRVNNWCYQCLQFHNRWDFCIQDEFKTPDVSPIRPGREDQ